jgi:hypothetical protein
MSLPHVRLWLARSLAALLFACTLLLPLGLVDLRTVQPVAAGGFLCNGPGIVLTFGLGLATCSLDPRGVAPERPCSLSNDVFAGGDTATHRYRFDLTCYAAGQAYLAATISATYNTQTHVARESGDRKVYDGDPHVNAAYLCDADPWTAEGGLPACTLSTADADPPAQTGGSVYGTSSFVSDAPNDAPWSAWAMGAQSRHVLKAQLDNVLSQAARAAATATPTPPSAAAIVAAVAPNNGSVLRGVIGASAKDVDITSPKAGQALHDVLVNAEFHLLQPSTSDKFALEWSYRPNNSSDPNAWSVLQLVGYTTLDKSKNLNGMTVPFASFLGQTDWRLRARSADDSSAPWSDYVQFQVK